MPDPSPAENGQRRKRGETRKSAPADPIRQLPQSVEAERALLCSMMLDPKRVIGESVEKLGEEHFYYPAHIAIYVALVELWTKNEGVDLITLGQALANNGLLETIGGPAYLSEVYTCVPTAANAEYYAGILRQKFLLRSVINTCTGCIVDAYDSQEQAETVLDQVEQKIFEIRDAQTQMQSKSIRELVMTAIEQVERLSEHKGGLTGLPSGLQNLDRVTYGLQPSEMFVIAARPSMGKTALAMNIVTHVAVVEKKAVAVFSLEMSAHQLVQRMLCSLARVDLSRMRGGFMAERDFARLTNAASELHVSPIHIDDTPALSILELRAKARRLKSQHDISLLVIDYLQLMRSPTRRAQENRQIEVAEISGGVKALAKELDIPVIVLAQLNRMPDERKGGEPRLSDLRESGAIEQDADVVGLLYRPDYYTDSDAPEASSELAVQAELKIAKNRNGPTDDVHLTFIKQYARFEDQTNPRAEGSP